MQSPKSLYQDKIKNNQLSADPYQASAVDVLDQLFWKLETAEKAHNEHKSKPWFSRVLFKSEAESIQGLYLWGGVGRGKTHLCDMFYNLVTTNRKMRLHYHRFMILVQDELMSLEGEVDPLGKVAASWAEKYKLLVLDEMHINDITNALLMKRLLQGLFDQGVVLVTTSNTPPSGLYKNGLQRQEFLPAIDLLEQHTRVMCLDGSHDYRLQTLSELQTYITPITAQTDALLHDYFMKIGGVEPHEIKTGQVIINHREIDIVQRAAEVIWFEFDTLCNTPRANQDYIEIANFYHTVIVSNVPQMDKYLEDAARRFVNMIDEFYDNSTNVIFSAHISPEQLYIGEKLSFEFERALSRILEMQSTHYFAKTRAA